MGRYDLSKEAEATDKELISVIRKLGALSDENIDELLPDRTDQDELKRLIMAVNEATSENQKKAILSARLGDVSVIVKNIVLKLIYDQRQLKIPLMTIIIPYFYSCVFFFCFFDSSRR